MLPINPSRSRPVRALAFENTALFQRVDKLDRKERVAARVRVYLVTKLAREIVRLYIEKSIDELASFGIYLCIQIDLDVAVIAFHFIQQRAHRMTFTAAAFSDLVGTECANDENRRALDATREMKQQIDAGRVCPVQVVDDENQGTFGCKTSQNVGELVEHLRLVDACARTRLGIFAVLNESCAETCEQ